MQWELEFARHLSICSRAEKTTKIHLKYLKIYFFLSQERYLFSIKKTSSLIHVKKTISVMLSILRDAEIHSVGKTGSFSLLNQMVCVVK
jgi:hypothetical protein